MRCKSDQPPGSGPTIVLPAPNPLIFVLPLTSRVTYLVYCYRTPIMMIVPESASLGSIPSIRYQATVALSWLRSISFYRLFVVTFVRKSIARYSRCVVFTSVAMPGRVISTSIRLVAVLIPCPNAMRARFMSAYKARVTFAIDR